MKYWSCYGAAHQLSGNNVKMKTKKKQRLLIKAHTLWKFSIPNTLLKDYCAEQRRHHSCAYQTIMLDINMCSSLL